MKLEVLKPKQAEWYEDGLTFTCSQCGNCCTGAPGYVWVSDDELDRLATHLNMTVEAVKEKYCRNIGGRISLQERRSPQGLYDCVFLTEVKAKARPGQVAQARQVCSIYEVRPLQCRTWPFWDGVLASKESWDAAGQRCHGINNGRRSFSFEQIETLRRAEDWPKNPPTSSSK